MLSTRRGATVGRGGVRGDLGARLFARLRRSRCSGCQDTCVTVRRGQGYTLRVSAPPVVDRQLLAQLKARRECENRVSVLTSTVGP